MFQDQLFISPMQSTYSHFYPLRFIEIIYYIDVPKFKETWAQGYLATIKQVMVQPVQNGMLHCKVNSCDFANESWANL